VSAARPLVDAEARRAIREDLGTTLVVEAAAGTGKTTALVGRVVELLRTGAGRLATIVAVTFTDKAAGEMKLRLRAEIEKARAKAGADGDERKRFDDALAELEVARIGTIHSLCADLLREHPVEAGVDPVFQVAAGDESEAIYAAAFEAWYERALAAPGEGARRVLRRRPRGREATGPRQLLYRAGFDLLDHRDFDAPWRREPFDRERALDEAVDALRDVAADAGRAHRADDFLAQNLAEIGRFLEDLDRRERVRASRDHDGLEAELRELLRKRSFHWKGGGRAYGPGLVRADVLARRDAARDRADALVRRADADLAACLATELRPLVAAYEALLSKAGKLDFLDLLVRTRDLLARDGAGRARLQQRTSHVLVDEFQDTDPLQAEILLLLAAADPSADNGLAAVPAPGKLFVVGDPKQSIYRFRRADVALYEAIKRRLVEHGARVVHLVTSFRSAPSIQSVVNAAFAPKMKGAANGSQAEYVALEPHREAPRGQPTVVALPVPDPYGDYGKVVSWRVEASLPDAVGAFVDWLVTASGWRVSEREGQGTVPVEARHVCLLFKRLQAFREDVTRPYVRALEARGVPHVLVGGRSYHDREEVLAVRNALAAIERPDDELSVFATLRGPLFALADDALLAHRATFGGLHPLRAHEADRAAEAGVGEVVEALAVLGRLHAGRNRRPIADTIARLLEATRAHAGVAIWPTGEQALANLLRVGDLARRFEAGGATSFRAFVDKLEDDAASGDVAEAPVVEEGADGVRLMTVHRAKGLEFPVVILVDPTAPAAQKHPSRWVSPRDRLWSTPLAQCTPVELEEHAAEVLAADAAEAVRLAYVAATRARDLLVVPTCGDEPIAGWLDPLMPAVSPLPSERRRARRAEACPAFGPDSVRKRPANVERAAESSVAPGLHRPQAGAHEVVWWDPNVLDLGREADAGLRQQRILEADEGGATARASEEAHASWQAARAHAIEAGSAPSAVVRTPTELAATAAEGDVGAVPLEHTDAPREGRPRGKRFGTLVHGVLAEAPFGASRDDVAAIARALARHEDAPAAEIDAAVEAAIAAFAHPLLVRAAAAAARGECRREAPITQRLEDGSVVDGTVDLAFREPTAEGAAWTVVDFKTDADPARLRARYEAQIRLYARAIHAATGEPASAVLLAV
jgi:ATP-dependent exoDNAse (exonuclease V) beta subunit